MFNSGKFKSITTLAVLAAMLVQPFSAWAATGGTQPEPVLVKLTPAAVTIDTSTLPPKLAEAENDAVWRLFDRDTATLYAPSQCTRITVSLPSPKTISRLRVFGASSYQLNVYRDNAGTWESVPSLCGLSLDALNKNVWNTVAASTPFSAQHLLLELIPQGNTTAGVAELELWGPDTAASQGEVSFATLAGLSTPQQALNLLAKGAPQIFAVAATPSEISVPDGSADQSYATATISLSQNPALFKRAYFLYDGYNISRAVSIQKRINNGTWTGGFAVPQPAGTTPGWAAQLEEINPAWLVQGENTLLFRSLNGTAGIRNLQLVVETDSGWNSVASVSSPAAYDGDTSTSFALNASANNPTLQVNFERPVEPEKIRLHVNNPIHLKATLQYASGNGWQEVKPGWQLDLSTLQPGWNEIAVPAQVATGALRLTFDTRTLRLKTGVASGAINEIRVCASPTGPASTGPQLVVSYPRNGEYFGRTAYIQGFATPAVTTASTAQVDVEGKQAANQDGAFSVALSKDETSYSAQPDDTAWAAQVASAYAGLPGAALSVPLTSNVGSAAADPKVESRGDAPFADNRDKYSEKVAPGLAKKIEYKGVTLDIPAGAVDVETELTIIPLNEADLARLDPGMVNVTYPAAGYRFLPHGMKFKKPIRITFGYSKTLFAAGQTPDDVAMFFYNESLLRWQPLTKVKVDATVSQVISESDHFTDIINSTLVVPEHPQALSLNPNSIKDIKAADPSANIDLIEPPKANPSGTANLSYPIEIPKGRGAYTPDLKVSYSSSNVNGWMGLGWDIAVSKIQVDTRWGVPLYDTAKETESYLLDGVSLAPHQPRPFTASESRATGDKAFVKRVEGDFKQIIRKQTSPTENDPTSAYYWEVTDKNGTKFTYGQTSQARLSSYQPGKNNIYQWNLEKVLDSNGNLTEFTYETDSGVNGDPLTGEPFKQIYLAKIVYTRHVGTNPLAALYSVEFNRSIGRTDVSIDGKPGFQVLTRERLNSVDVKYNGASIRQYLFSYIPDAEANEFHFGKSLLQKITHKGKGGDSAKEFYSHDFTYERMAENSPGVYKGFKDTIKQWGGASGGKRLSDTEDLTASISISIGVSPDTGNWPIFGFQGNYGQGRSTTRGLFLDVNGDGLPDRISSGGAVELNQLNPNDPDRESGSFTPAAFPGIGKLGYSRNDNFSIGGQIGYWIGAGNAAYSYNFVNNETMMTDIDGDGFVDQVDVSGGGLSVLKNDGKKFTPTSWSGYSLAGVNFGNDDAATKLKGDFFLADPVRKWIAPYKGTVHVTGAVQKVRAGGHDDPVDPNNPSGPKASVLAFIYQNGDSTPLWNATIQAVDISTHSHDLTIPVNPGDRLYFRVNSVDDTEADAVSWQPEIDYQQVCVTQNGTEQCVTVNDYQLLDPLGHPLLKFEAGKELRLSGNPKNIWKAGAKGRVTITGKVVKKKSSDDVTFAIKLNDSTVLWSGSALAGDEGVFSHDLTGQELNQGDLLTFDVMADTSVDPNLVSWQPEIKYENYCFEKPNTTPKEFTCGDVVCSPDGSGKLQCSINSGTLPPGAVIEEKDIHQYGQANYPFYYLTPTAPSRFWVAPFDGTVRVQGSIVRSSQTDGFLAIARGANRLLWKQSIPAGGQQGSTQAQPATSDSFPQDFTVTVAKGDQIFFDIQSETQIDPTALAWSPSITYTQHCSTDPLTGQQVCTPISQSGTSWQYCDTYSDRTVCHAMTCASGTDPLAGGCQSCDTTTYNNDPTHPQKTCQPVTCTIDPLAGESCTPTSFTFQGPPPAIRYKDTRFYDTSRPDVEAFGGGYRQWFYGDWNGNLAWDETKIKLTKPTDVPTTDNFKGDDYKNLPSYFFVNLSPKWQGVEGYQNPVWSGRGKNEFIGVDQESSSRLGANVGAIIAGTGIGTIQQSVSNNFVIGASMIAGLSYTFGDSTGKLDFIDMNGDHFPDQVSNGSVLFNTGAGGFATSSSPFTVGDIRKIDNSNVSYQVGYTWAQNHQNAKGVTVKLMSVGASLGLAYGVSNTESDLIDINGDGLPDRVKRVGPNAFEVQLNFGYRFGNPVIWQTDSWGKGNIGTIKDEPLVKSDADALQLNENLTYSGSASFFGIGGGASYTVARTMVALRDINGDGLPDQILKIGKDFYVKLNMGDHFGPAQIWQAPDWNRDVADGVITDNIPGNNDAINYTSTDSYQLSVGVPIMIPIPLIPIIWLDITPSISVSGGFGGSALDFQDINGDGLPDHILKLKDDNAVYVRMNNVGKTNLLKEVHRPLGGSFTLDYQRVGNTVEMPHSQWVMKEVKLSDGMQHTYTTAYNFSDGYYDRLEREFLGFGRVEETHAPGTAISRTIAETFLNRDYYLKNLLEKSVTSDWKGNVWAKSANSYVATDVVSGSKFPELRRTDTYFYDGTAGEDGSRKSTYQTFVYDSYGNVTTFFDAGELSTNADDVTATIDYWRDPQQYIIKPKQILVTNVGGTILRKRWAIYNVDGTGNLKTHTSQIKEGQNEAWGLTYDSYGNLFTITDPVSYSLTYSYDPDTASYVTQIADNFSAKYGGPYYSTAGYDLALGQPLWTKDLNGNYDVRRYDDFGRLTSVYGPYDTDAFGNPVGIPTIGFTYNAPVFNTDGVTISSLASAVTRNKAVSRVGSVGKTLDTVTFIDGMKRLSQTKKEADVNGSYGMTVSGLTVYDDMGRTIQQGQPVFQGSGDLYGYLSLQYPKNPTNTYYDPLDRTVRLETPDAKAPNGYAVTTTTYGFGQVNNSGPLYATTKVVDPIGNAAQEANHKGTKISYKDVEGKIVAVVEYNFGSPITTTYLYDPLGQITTVIDDKTNTTSVEYDQVGRRTAITNPDTGRTDYGYDAGGNLVSKLTANYPQGKEINYQYVFNRLMKINYPFSTPVSYEYGPMGAAYNQAGRITKVTDESGIEARYYGKLGETVREEKIVQAHTPAVQSKKFTTDYVFDSFGRMNMMTYPDGETLYYSYDNGGLLNAAWGEKSGNRYNYINSLTYDEFGQRKHIANGNGVTSDYTYDELTRRLSTLITVTSDSRTIQNLSYDYDLVGNVLKMQNAISTPTNTALPAGPVVQVFEYDDLYQLKTADGEYAFGPGKQNRYRNEFFYDSIGNFTTKSQIHKILQPSAAEHLPKETNYLLDYKYTGSHPHAVTDAGDKLYSYDNNGNMTGWTSKTNGQKRTIFWNEENRVKEIDDNGKATYFLYDDAGERVLKRGQYGETIYANRFYSLKNGELGTKSIYAGSTRVVTKLVKTPNTNTNNTGTSVPTGSVPTTTTTTGSLPNQGIQNALSNGNGKKLGILKRLPAGTTTGINPPVEKDEFFYHGDHLGSSNMITDAYGAVYQHLEYFPFGETWIDEGKTNSNIPGYQFTGKELDPETGLYYYGARYYEPVISRWISPDPILGEYLPTGDKEKDKNLAGGGGVFQPLNISLYCYGYSNPIKYLDPDGNEDALPDSIRFYNLAMSAAAMKNVSDPAPAPAPALSVILSGSTHGSPKSEVSIAGDKIKGFLNSLTEFKIGSSTLNLKPESKLPSFKSLMNLFTKGDVKPILENAGVEAKIKIPVTNNSAVTFDGSFKGNNSFTAGFHFELAFGGGKKSSLGPLVNPTGTSSPAGNVSPPRDLLVPPRFGGLHGNN